MKQYTNESQTAKLVELGFVPKMRIKSVSTKNGIVYIENEPYFDVGKLIEMLPVEPADFLGADFEFCNTELVDALYDMVVKLKAKGVI